MKLHVTGIVFLLAATRAASTFAGEPGAAPTPDDAMVSARLAYVERALQREEASTRTWHDGWLGAFSALAVLQVAVGSATTDAAVRGTAIVGGTKSLLAVASILVVPYTPLTASTTLRRLGAGTPSDRRTRLQLAESLLQRSASEERLRRSWVPLVAGALLNLGGATVMWAGYHRGGSGWFGLGSGMAIGQLYYHSQPTGAIGAWAAYARARDQGAPPPSTASLATRAPGPSWSLAPSPGGVVVQGTF
jgi:hypothetical protein